MSRDSILPFLDTHTYMRWLDKFVDAKVYGTAFDLSNVSVEMNSGGFFNFSFRGQCPKELFTNGFPAMGASFPMEVRFVKGSPAIFMSPVAASKTEFESNEPHGNVMMKKTEKNKYAPDGDIMAASLKTTMTCRPITSVDQDELDAMKSAKGREYNAPMEAWLSVNVALFEEGIARYVVGMKTNAALATFQEALNKFKAENADPWTAAGLRKETYQQRFAAYTAGVVDPIQASLFATRDAKHEYFRYAMRLDDAEGPSMDVTNDVVRMITPEEMVLKVIEKRKKGLKQVDTTAYDRDYASDRRMLSKVFMKAIDKNKRKEVRSFNRRLQELFPSELKEALDFLNGMNDQDQWQCSGRVPNDVGLWRARSFEEADELVRETFARFGTTQKAHETLLAMSPFLYVPLEQRVKVFPSRDETMEPPRNYVYSFILTPTIFVKDKKTVFFKMNYLGRVIMHETYAKRDVEKDFPVESITYRYANLFVPNAVSMPGIGVQDMPPSAMKQLISCAGSCAAASSATSSAN